MIVMIITPKYIPWFKIKGMGVVQMTKITTVGKTHGLLCVTFSFSIGFVIFTEQVNE